MNTEKIILGIDPGTTIMGFGIIKVVGKKMEFIQMNELLLQKYDDHYLKLKLIFERTVELIDTFNPDEIAIEAPFFGKNVQSMLKLGRAQGVAMAAGLSREIPITEYLPKKIKMAITGNGNASKEQVALMLKSLLNLKTLPKKYRDPLFLSDMKGLKQKDIAITLKLKLAITKSRIQRARNLIKQAYVLYCDYKVN